MTEKKGPEYSGLTDRPSTVLAEEAEKKQELIRAAIAKAPIPRTQINKSRCKMSDSLAGFNHRSYRSGRSSWKVLSCAASIPIRQDTWAIKDWLPEGKLSLLAGPPGSGKTTIALMMGASISQGRDYELWPGQAPAGRGNVLFSSTEDNFASTIKTRFLAAGGNENLFHNLSGIPAHHPSIPYFIRQCTFSDADNEIWCNEAKAIGSLGLAIFDPASQVVNGDAGNNSKARECYENIGKIAEQLDFAVLGIVHTIKTAKGKDPLNRLAGPGAVAQVARSIMMVTKIECGPLSDGATHVLVLAKAFGEPVNYGVTYSIVGADVADKNGIIFKSSKIRWHQIIPGTSEEILAWAEMNKKAGNASKLDVAINFLKETLLNRALPFPEIKNLAMAAQISMATLNRAKQSLGIISKKQTGAGQDSPFLWSLPVDEAVN